MPVLALPLRQARGPRFLLMLLGLWMAVRAATYWPGEVGVVPPPSPFDPATEYAAQTSALDAPTAANATPRRVAARRLSLAPVSVPSKLALAAVNRAAPSGYSGHARHAWRLALLGRFGVGPGRVVPSLALPQPAAAFAPGLAPLQPVPRWAGESSPGRWSLAVASYWRSGGEGAPPVGPASTARLGGSQTAARLTYLVDSRLALRAYMRATHTPGRRDGVDVAVGVALRPLGVLPVDVHVEQRVAVAGAGRDTTLVYAAGGVDNQRLPLDFRLSAYAQAGVADYGGTVGFADAAVAVQREVAARRGMRLSLGTMVAAAAQPGAQRVDVGPRAALSLPQLGQGAQIALDWRERVAGNARPGSGLALTLAADF